MHIYLFSPIPYSFVHQRPQKLADQFQALSNAVTYIEPCGFTEYIADRKKGLIRLLFWSVIYQVLGFLAFVRPHLRTKPLRRRRKARPRGLEVISMPLVIPQNRFNSEILEQFNASVYRQVLMGKVFRSMREDEETVAIVQNPFWGCVIKEGDFSRVYYDCIDEISLFSGHASVSRFLKYESNLANMCEAIFVTAEKLEDHIKSLNVDVPVVRVPNGVDYAWFQERVSTLRGLEDLKTIRRPIVGYVGVLRAWFDYALLGKMADALPGVSFVVVGPLDIQERIKNLRQHSNIYWLGRKEYDEIPLYINAFDACIIPFIQGKVSQTTNPVKIFEYFALGKPVVTSKLYELKPYTENELVYMADEDDQFLDLLRIALAERDHEKKRLRKEIAQEHSWRAQVERMRAVILSAENR